MLENKKRINDYIRKARGVHGDKYDYSKVKFSNIRIDKIKIICKKHGVFEQRADVHLYGGECGKCKNSIKRDSNYFIEKAKKIHGDKYDYSKVEYINAKTKVEIICDKHGSFFQLPTNHYRSNCPECSKGLILENKKNNYGDCFVDKAKKIHGDRYDYSKVDYKTAKTKVEIICDKHGSFFQLPNDHLGGKGCLKCGLCFSVAEKKLVDFIKTFYFNTIIENTRLVIKPKEIDIYLPNKKIGIEYNGLYTHSSDFKEKNYHLNKTKESLNNGIELIQIFEDEWIEKNEIVKSIIKIKLGYFENKINSDDTIVKKVSFDNTKKFLDKNHIYGSEYNSNNIGLYYNNELVSIMVFENNHIVQYCDKLNTFVIGGAAKILNFFKNKYSSDNITFCLDKRFFSHNTKFNFEYLSSVSTSPNCFFVYSNKRYKKIDSSNRNHKKIFDCGIEKFIVKSIKKNSSPFFI